MIAGGCDISILDGLKNPSGLLRAINGFRYNIDLRL